jgi:hypothetical protein
MANEQNLVVTPNLSGNEVMICSLGGPGATSIFVGMNTIRNSTGYVTVAGASVTGTYQIPAGVNRLIITSQPSVATIQLPLSPTDGGMCEIVNGTASAFATNAVTVNVAAGPTLVGGAVTITTLGAGASVEFQYSLALNTWYRIR